MGKQYDQITPALQSFIQAQPLFFVATAPLSEEGLADYRRANNRMSLDGLPTPLA